MSGQAFSGDAERRRAFPWDLGHPFWALALLLSEACQRRAVLLLGSAPVICVLGLLSFVSLPVSTRGAPGLPGRKRLVPGPGGPLVFGARALTCQAYVFFGIGAELWSSAIPEEEPGPRFSAPSGYGCEMYTKCFSTSPTCFFWGSSQKWRHISPPGIGEPGIVPNSFTGER